MALHDVSTEGTSRGGGELKVYLRAGFQGAERGAVQCLLREVGVEELRIDIKGGKADPGDGQRVTFAKTAGDARSFDRDATDASAVSERDEDARLLDDSGEHEAILWNAGTRAQGAEREETSGH